MLSRVFWISAFSVCTAISGCGGNDDGELYGKSGAAGTGATPATGGGGYGQGGAPSGGSASGGAPSGGAPSGGAPSGGAPSGGFGGSAANGGSSASGGVPSGGFGGSAASGGTGGSAAFGGGESGGSGGGAGGSIAKPAVACGPASCELPGQFCCQEWNGFSYAGHCTPSGGGCGGTDVFCDGPTDCAPGSVCCGQLSSNQTYYVALKCVPQGSCSYGSGMRLFCGDQPGVCPSGTSCKASGVLPPYNVCASN